MAQVGPTYTATDGTTEFIVRDENNGLGLVVGTQYESISGIVQQFDADYQLIPRSKQDIVVDSSIIQPVFCESSKRNICRKDNSYTINKHNTMQQIFYTLDGTDPIEFGVKYEAPISN